MYNTFDNMLNVDFCVRQRYCKMRNTEQIPFVSSAREAVVTRNPVHTVTGKGNAEFCATGMRNVEQIWGMRMQTAKRIAECRIPHIPLSHVNYASNSNRSTQTTHIFWQLTSQGSQPLWTFFNSFRTQTVCNGFNENIAKHVTIFSTWKTYNTSIA